MWLPSWPKTKLYIPYVFHTLPDGLGDNEIVRLFLSPERQEISESDVELYFYGLLASRRHATQKMLLCRFVSP